MSTTTVQLREPISELKELALLYQDIQIEEWRCGGDLITIDARVYSGQARLVDPELQGLAISIRCRLDRLRNRLGWVQLSLVSLILDLRDNPTLFAKHDDEEYCEEVEVEVEGLKEALLECQERVTGLQYTFERIFKLEGGFYWGASRLEDWSKLFINPYLPEAWQAPRDSDDED